MVNFPMDGRLAKLARRPMGYDYTLLRPGESGPARTWGA